MQTQMMQFDRDGPGSLSAERVSVDRAGVRASTSCCALNSKQP